MMFKITPEALEEIISRATILKPNINREKLDYAKKHLIHHLNASQTIYTTRIPLEEEPAKIRYSNYVIKTIYKNRDDFNNADERDK